MPFTEWIFRTVVILGVLMALALIGLLMAQSLVWFAGVV